jgi:hypothetical protein
VGGAGGRIELFAQAPRVYELYFPGATGSELADGIVRDFRESLALLARCGETLWQVYGVSAWLRASARLQSASLLPGKTVLTFRDGKSVLALASLSLADRLLDHQSVKQWAQRTLPEVAGRPEAQWEESLNQATVRVRTRRMLRRRTHHLTLIHDVEGNRLTYTHRQT